MWFVKLNYVIPLAGQSPRIHNASNSEVSIDQFTELYLYCNADGLPIPKAEWIKVMAAIQVFLFYFYMSIFSFA